MKRTLFFLAIAGARIASAQTVSFGVKGGVSLIDQTSSQDESRPYIVGPSVEVQFFDHVGIEADALYQRLGNTLYFSISAGVPLSLDVNRERGNSWEFPLLGKYYFRSPTTRWRPFFGTGYVFRTIGLHEAVTRTVLNADGTPQALTSRFDSRSSLGIGATFSAGLRARFGPVSLMPEIRYTRWGNQDNLTRKNEAAFLFGINF
jgi:hypothetical protein